MKRRAPRVCESLEPRRCLTVGWDGPGLGSAELTYYVANAPPGFSQASINELIADALDVWASVAAITFTRTATPNLSRSLDIDFDEIDGAGEILGQAYFPDDVAPRRLAGDVTLDSAENWEIGNKQGAAAYDLLQVAVHEIGHALGLDHSTVAGSVMAATVSANASFTALHSSDRAAILKLYAPATNEPSPVYTNPRDAADVNDDGIVSPVDVLLLLNPINDGLSGPVSAVRQSVPEAADWYLDPSGDGQLTPTDVVIVVNRLNDAATAAAEVAAEEQLGFEPDVLYAGDSYASSDAAVAFAFLAWSRREDS